jgi:hypothetical protein
MAAIVVQLRLTVGNLPAVTRGATVMFLIRH